MNYGQTWEPGHGLGSWLMHTRPTHAQFEALHTTWQPISVQVSTSSPASIGTSIPPPPQAAITKPRAIATNTLRMISSPLARPPKSRARTVPIDLPASGQHARGSDGGMLVRLAGHAKSMAQVRAASKLVTQPENTRRIEVKKEGAPR
jgi:hypothetical protein